MMFKILKMWHLPAPVKQPSSSILKHEYALQFLRCQEAALGWGCPNILQDMIYLNLYVFGAYPQGPRPLKPQRATDGFHRDGHTCDDRSVMGTRGIVGELHIDGLSGQSSAVSWQPWMAMGR